jgi:hypothetical protein
MHKLMHDNPTMANFCINDFIVVSNNHKQNVFEVLQLLWKKSTRWLKGNEEMDALSLEANYFQR